MPESKAGIIALTTDIPAGVDVIVCDSASSPYKVNISNFNIVDGKQLYIDFSNANEGVAATFSPDNGTTTDDLYMGPSGTTNPTWLAGDVLRIEYRNSNTS